ncbi:phage I-like protein [Chelatococcus caeni]|uniref:Phage I-like protein n=1 Tax=Chelatococcus caeni TaxID=1348468 RepID=A0A840C171_9HYPH|nr:MULTISPECIES: phage protease [Chelatococcus]MBB4016726.1 phage I-like protein [Chelatococcus caeni]
MPKRTATPRDEILPADLIAGGVAFEVVTAAADGEVTLPEWIQLTPRGRVTARDGRVFAFDPERLAAGFTAGGLKLPIDFDHETEFTMMLGAKPARGWIVAVEARPEGLFGRVEWLPDAVEALQARRYRYISPTFWREEDGMTARLLKGAALVTSPALGMPAVASAHLEDPMLKELLAALGLADTATLDDAKGAIARLSAIDPDKYVPKEQHEATAAALAQAQATIAAARDAAEAARCSSLVDEAVTAGKIAPAARDHYVALARANYDATKAAIDAMPVVVPPGVDPATATADPSTGAAGQLSDAEKEIAAKLGIEPAAFLAARRV